MLSRQILAIARDLLYVLLVAAVAWVSIALTGVLDDVTARRLAAAGADDLRARVVRTQVGLLRRVLAIAIGLLALSAVAERFQGLETLGTGLVA